jgi:N-acetylglucosamine-6-phosphate deacetylase
MRTIFTGHRLFTPLDEVPQPLLEVEDGRISRISSRVEEEAPANATLVDFGDAVLVPGFIDIHIHGGAGIDVMLATGSDLSRLGEFLAQHGVTGYFPTTVGAPLDATCFALERLANEIEEAASGENGKSPQARPLGVHLEGPFLSHKRRGVHPPENLVSPTLAIFERLWQAARGHVRMITIAPELPGALEVIAEAAKRNVCVSIGHSDAELPVAQAAVKAGARHATHTFNAMRPLDHRDPGIIGEVLTNDGLSADVIADGIHVAPEIVRLFLRAKGIERAVLITDATAATGMPDGKYQLGPIEVDVKDGKCTKDGKLAGSVLTMDRAVRNVTKFAQWSLQNAVRAASLNAARAAGLAGHGLLAPGTDASFTVLDSNGEVKATVVRGRRN